MLAFLFSSGGFGACAMGPQVAPLLSPCGVFPIIHWEDGEISTVDDDQLPVQLPDLQDYKPGDGGQSPLANATEWLQVTDKNGRKGIRETNTMPQWAGSCWYYLRYIDACNGDAFLAKELEKYWMPVDLYVGGAEHAVLHLLYSRFWHKSVQNECRDEMLAFRHDRVQPRTPKASKSSLTSALSLPTNRCRNLLGSAMGPQAAPLLSPCKFFAKLLHPFAPHIAEEMWSLMGHGESLTNVAWPKGDESKTVESTVEVVFQVNGKLRAKVNVDKNLDKAALDFP